MKAAACRFLAAAALLTLAAADPVAERLARFKATGGDPLTVPVSFYEGRTERVTGAPRALPAGPPRRLRRTAIDAAMARAQGEGADALLILENGRLVAERYWNGAGTETRFNPQSMAKTVAALLVGIAIDRGEIETPSQPIGTWIEAWADDPRGRITLEQLLRMTSGLGQLDAGKGMALTADNPAVRHYFGDDFLAPVLALPLKGVPGEQFDYNNANTLLVAHILEQVSGKPYAELVSERLWRPLGNADATIYRDRPGGTAMASCCLFSSARDWARVGRLIANGGEVDGKRIVTGEWLIEMRSSSPATPGYGLQIWLGNQQVGGTPLPPVVVPWQSEGFDAADVAILNGFGGQRVWLLPTPRLVVVRLGTRWPNKWDDSAIPNILTRGVQ